MSIFAFMHQPISLSLYTRNLKPWHHFGYININFINKKTIWYENKDILNEIQFPSFWSMKTLKNIIAMRWDAMTCQWNNNKIFGEYFHFCYERTSCATFHRISLNTNAFHLNLIADWEFFIRIDRINWTENCCDNNFDWYLDYWKHMRLQWPKI